MLELDGSATDLPASAYEAAWSPDGTRIAFVATSGDGGSEDPVEWNEDIWVANADGTGARKVVSSIRVRRAAAPRRGRPMASA